MAIITSGLAGISQRTNVYAERQMLAHAGPVTVLEKFGKSVRMPKNKSTTIKFRRPIVFTAAVTPLVEGVTPTSTNFTYEDVTATLKQFGQVSIVTDVIEDTHEDPVLNDVTRQSGENIGRTIEALTYAVLKAGTNVFYNNGASRSAVNTAITLNKIRAVTRALYANKAKKITSILSPSPDYGTSGIEAAYVAVAHTDLAADLRGLTGFTPVVDYGSRKPICPEEFGTVEDVRFILSPDLGPFTSDADKGGAVGTMIPNATTPANAAVYPVLFFGQEAYGLIAIRGQGAVEPSIIPVGQKTKDDPLGQRGYVGWKTWFVAVILNELWMARLETAATLL